MVCIWLFLYLTLVCDVCRECGSPVPEKVVGYGASWNKVVWFGLRSSLLSLTQFIVGC